MSSKQVESEDLSSLLAAEIHSDNSNLFRLHQTITVPHMQFLFHFTDACIHGRPETLCSSLLLCISAVKPSRLVSAVIKSGILGGPREF